ncbi:MAG: hypothetical protein KME17_19220 [Cyanosarcina radialis HA8281-LM2]|jgi:hypothetical protein|nr:hypothetical protein [Cyanosarcina radialis HA8281-LM2]
MKNGDPKLCISVSEFFNLVNWQGVQLTPLSLEVTDEKPWQSVSVKEFFGRFNWQGQPLVSHRQNRPEPSFYLTSPVGRFFQAIAWDGNPEIGSLPKPLSVDRPVVSEEMKLTNLSELF